MTAIGLTRRIAAGCPTVPHYSLHGGNHAVDHKWNILIMARRNVMKVRLNVRRLMLSHAQVIHGPRRRIFLQVLMVVVCSSNPVRFVGSLRIDRWLDWWAGL